MMVAGLAAHAVQEDLLHGGKQQAGALGVVHVKGCAGGQDHHTGQDGEDGVEQGHDDGVLLQALLLVQVGAEGDVDAHGHGQGEEDLPRRRLQHVKEAAGAGEEAHVRLEHELVALQRTGLHGYKNDDADEDDAQRRHDGLAELLDAPLHAAHDDGHGADQEEGKEEDHALAAVQQPAEEAAALPGEAVRTEDLDQKAQAVAQDHAAQHRVEGQDEEGRNDRHPANEGILFAQGRIRAACAFAGLSAQSKLAQHPHDAHQGDQDEVEDEEGKAAGLAHFIGEGPEVAQANGRADGRHEEAEAAPPLTTFGCLHSEFLSP